MTVNDAVARRRLEAECLLGPAQARVTAVDLPLGRGRLHCACSSQCPVSDFSLEGSDEHPFLSSCSFHFPAPMHHSLQFLTITASSQGCVCHSEGPSVIRSMLCSVCLKSCFIPCLWSPASLSCYEALLSRLGSRAGPQHNANIKEMAKSPGTSRFIDALRIAKPRCAAVFLVCRGPPRPPGKAMAGASRPAGGTVSSATSRE